MSRKFLTLLTILGALLLAWVSGVLLLARQTLLMAAVMTAAFALCLWLTLHARTKGWRLLMLLGGMGAVLALVLALLCMVDIFSAASIA